jgi:hypothetical protein
MIRKTKVLEAYDTDELLLSVVTNGNVVSSVVSMAHTATLQRSCWKTDRYKLN